MIHPLHVAVELWVGSRVWLQQWMDMDWKHTLFQGISRIVVTIIAVYIAIVFPGFDRVMVRHPFTCAWYTYIHHVIWYSLYLVLYSVLAFLSYSPWFAINDCMVNQYHAFDHYVTIACW